MWLRGPAHARGLAWVCACLAAAPALAAAPPAAPGQVVSSPAAPSPEAFLGFRVGADRKLADWNEIVAYFQALDAASERVRVAEVGRTTEGRPFLIATITSAANMARLEAIRQANLRLADPRGLSDAEAEALLRDGKAIVASNHGIHASEVGASQTALELAWQLATRDDPQTREVLDNVVLLMIPSHNPDGTQRVVEWYRTSLGTPWEGGTLPFLYHPYAGHDNNRDWYMFTQVETRLTVEHLYDRWRPQIVHDLHQMGPRGARIFVPPYLDPWEPNVDPALVGAVNALGAHVAARLIAQDRTGVVTHAIYDAWTPSRAYPHTHGGVRFLSETASARMASPLETPFARLVGRPGYDPLRASWNYPAPWRGGNWRLGDVLSTQLAASWALLEHAAHERDFWLRNFVAVNRRAASRQDPFAFVVPAAQRDPLATARLVAVLRTGGVEIQRATAPFAAGGAEFAAGSHVIPMAQPFSAFAKTLLEPQHYPGGRDAAGRPLRPYDVTAHSLPLLLGVDVRAVAEPFTASLEPVRTTRVAAGRVLGRGRHFAFGHATGDLVALARLLAAGVPVRWASEAFADRGRRFEAGTLLVPASAQRRLAPLARELGIVAHGVDVRPAGLDLRRPRVGLYASWVASIDEGWTRFVFEQELGVAYATLRDAEVRAGGLRQRFDAIVLPDQTRAQLVNGHAPGSLPEEYTGGLGEAGVAALHAFVEAGGTLVALNAASELPLLDFGLPARNVLEKAGAAVEDEAPPPADAGDPFDCPGAILRVQVDPRYPLGHGLQEAQPIWFENGPAFAVAAGAPGAVVARYAEPAPLLSGWLLGGERLRGHAALVELPLGKGRVVLFGFRPQYRAQSWTTYVALLNAIYGSAGTPAAAGTPLR